MEEVETDWISTLVDWQLAKLPRPTSWEGLCRNCKGSWHGLANSLCPGSHVSRSKELVLLSAWRGVAKRFGK